MYWAIPENKNKQGGGQIKAPPLETQQNCVIPLANFKQGLNPRPLEIPST